MPNITRQVRRVGQDIGRPVAEKIRRLRKLLTGIKEEYLIPPAERHKRTQRRLIHHGVKGMVADEAKSDAWSLAFIKERLDSAKSSVKNPRQTYMDVATSPKFSERNRRGRVVERVRRVRTDSGSVKARKMIKHAGQKYFRQNNPWYKRP